MQIRLLFINFIVLLSLTVNGYSQEYITTGIMPFTAANRNQSEVVISQLTKSLQQYPFIKLVERSQMQNLVNEIQLSMTGLVNEQSALQQGKILGIKVMIFGAIDKNTISARAVHTETGRVIASSSHTFQSVEQIGNELAFGIESFLARENLKRMRNDSPDIQVDFWIETKDGKRVDPTQGLKIGNSVRFKFKANKSGYVTIVDIQPTGEVVILFPNEFRQDNKISAHTVYSIPADDDGFELTVTEPAGEDTITLFFTEKKVDWLDMKKLQGEGFKTVNTEERFAVTRGFAVTATQLNNKQWESVVLNINVKK